MDDMDRIDPARATVLAVCSATSAPVVDDRAAVSRIDPDDPAAGAAQLVAALTEVEGPAHLVAAGIDVLPALLVTLDRPELVRSLVLVDPIRTDGLADLAPMLGRVPVPTLVFAARADDTTDLVTSQTLAGEIPNGVFVVVDHCEPPVHVHRPDSFRAWASSFLAIVEGLRALDETAVLATTPTRD